MKIALLYSGHLRTIEKTFSTHNDFIKALSRVHEVKIFCQTWKTIESHTASWWKEEGRGDKSIDPRYILATTLKPDAVRINEDLAPIETPDFYKGLVSYNAVLSMFYSMKESYGLYCEYKQQHLWEADVLIKIRYDIFFDFDKLLHKIHELYMNNKDVMVFSSKTYDFYGGYSDIIVASSSSNNALYKAYDQLLNEQELRTYFNKFKEFIAEIFLAKFVFGFSKAIILYERLEILRQNGDLVDVSMSSKPLPGPEYFRNMHYTFIENYKDHEEFKNDVFNFLEAQALSGYKVFYADKPGMKELLAAAKYLKGLNKDLALEAIAYTIHNPKVSFLRKLPFQLLYKHSS